MGAFSVRFCLCEVFDDTYMRIRALHWDAPTRTILLPDTFCYCVESEI